MPVVETVAVEHGGVRHLVEQLEALPHPGSRGPVQWREPTFDQIQRTQRDVRRILRAIGYVGALAQAARSRGSTRS